MNIQYHDDKISNAIIYGCLSHVEINIDYPNYINPIFLGNACSFGDLNLNELAPNWVQYHDLLGGTAGTFALKNYILSIKNNHEFVGICQYRKFLSFEKIGVTAENYQVMDIISSKALTKEILYQSMIPEVIRPLFCQPGQFLHNGKNYSYLYQYKDVHHLQDLLRFTAMLIEYGVLDKDEAYYFLTEEVFMAGGIELGIFPIDFWLSNIIKLEMIVSECISFYPKKRDKYQIRAWAFCMERIGSYLLLKEFRKYPEWINKYCGYLNLVNFDQSKSYTPGI
jgi:hypothetical protein